MFRAHVVRGELEHSFRGNLRLVCRYIRRSACEALPTTVICSGMPPSRFARVPLPAAFPSNRWRLHIAFPRRKTMCVDPRRVAKGFDAGRQLRREAARRIHNAPSFAWRISYRIAHPVRGREAKARLATSSLLESNV